MTQTGCVMTSSSSSSAGVMRMFLLIILLIGLASSFRVGYPLSATNDEVILQMIKRLSVPQCLGSGGKCFRSAQCCRGFVCAAFDDYIGQNPEIPGFCVKEKDLTLCVDSDDCDTPRARCLALGRTGQRYCVHPNIHDLPVESEGRRRQASNQNYQVHGGLGSQCEDSTDCKVMMDDGSHLCCQDISRARLGVKRMCHRVVAISNCIAPSDE